MNAEAKQKLVWNILEPHNVTLTLQYLIPFPKMNGIKRREKNWVFLLSVSGHCKINILPWYRALTFGRRFTPRYTHQKPNIRSPVLTSGFTSNRMDMFRIVVFDLFGNLLVWGFSYFIINLDSNRLQSVFFFYTLVQNGSGSSLLSREYCLSSSNSSHTIILPCFFLLELHII